MPFRLGGRTISKVGVIGSGQIGPDIALYFSKVLAPHGVPIVVQDIAQAALDAGAAKTKKKIQKGAESGAFKPDEAVAMFRNISFTADLAALQGADFVVEAASERRDIKQGIFERLEPLVSPDAILASNSSHMEPEVIFEKVKRRERALVIHYFFPAERNLVVEVVPGADTSTAVADFCMAFYEAIGKVPIRVKSRYGYALDPIFEGVFLASLLMADAGIATPKQIDEVARKTLGLGVGPFTAMNLTGGSPITQVGLGNYHDKIMPWYQSTPSLDAVVAKKGQWETAARGETVTVPPDIHETVSNRLLGAYFGLFGEILQSGIVEAGDLEMGIELALDAKPPMQLMNKVGVARSLELVTNYAKENPGFEVAPVLADQASRGLWSIPKIFRRDADGVAVVTIKRPRVLNALDLDVYRQLKEEFERISMDRSIVGAVLTGFGVKAFVSGADVGMLAKIQSPADGESASRQSHKAQHSIENLGKPVVCALNGLSLGGGSELAYCCTARIARKGVKTLFGQPEVKLGIIPGAGGSVRLPRLVDFATAWKVLRTGGTISGPEALSLGLILEEVGDGLVDRAIEIVRKLASREMKAKEIPKGPIPVPSNLPEVDLGPLSRKVDEILRSAILEGAKLPFEQA
ncbi:MAG TPA: 3-hydroxyacyl-CoA dehydrogenase/enoyl-CoA hydratase family protein, partial [Planctomycetota bacterium]|nr:3-hydroxyacyl-CoA dehydrogenase/enoyl-CoA hydratase family protein [Planctomycetota bacterium]